MNKSGPRAVELSEGAILDAVESYERLFLPHTVYFSGPGAIFQIQNVRMAGYFFIQTNLTFEMFQKSGAVL